MGTAIQLIVAFVDNCFAFVRCVFAVGHCAGDKHGSHSCTWGHSEEVGTHVVWGGSQVQTR